MFRRMSEQAVIRAINLAGNMSALARLIGKPQTTVSTWKHRDKRVPADMVLTVSRALDWRITPHQLRPDIYPNATDGLPLERCNVVA